MQSFESDFSPADYTDEYQVQLKQLVDAKLEQGESVDTEATFGEQPTRTRRRRGDRPDGGAAAVGGGNREASDKRKRTPAKRGA